MMHRARIERTQGIAAEPPVDYQPTCLRPSSDGGWWEPLGGNPIPRVITSRRSGTGWEGHSIVGYQQHRASTFHVTEERENVATLPPLASPDAKVFDDRGLTTSTATTFTPQR